MEKFVHRCAHILTSACKYIDPIIYLYKYAFITQAYLMNAYIRRYIHTHMRSLTQRYNEKLSPAYSSVLNINQKLLVIIKPTIAVAFMFQLLMLIHFIATKFYCHEK
jgi:hypothetical protein